MGPEAQTHTYTQTPTDLIETALGYAGIITKSRLTKWIFQIKGVCVCVCIYMRVYICGPLFFSSSLARLYLFYNTFGYGLWGLFLWHTHSFGWYALCTRKIAKEQTTWSQHFRTKTDKNIYAACVNVKKRETDRTRLMSLWIIYPNIKIEIYIRIWVKKNRIRRLWTSIHKHWRLSYHLYDESMWAIFLWLLHMEFYSHFATSFICVFAA